MGSVLAVDAGRTNCRAAVFHTSDSGELVRGRAVTVPSPATLVDPDGPARVAGTVAAALAELVETAGPGAGLAPGSPLAVAAAGALRRPATAARAEAFAAQLRDQLAARFPEQPAARPGAGGLVVAGDVVAAHAGAFGGEPGVVLALGTGAIALAAGPGGQHAVVDGAGYLLGDAGSGFAVGRAGLAAAVRHADGRPGGSAALAAAAAARFGPVPEVPYALHSTADPARQVASFAADVAAAAREGEPVAAAIWRDAVAELAETVVAAAAAVTAAGRRVALVGTLFALDDLLTGPLSARLRQRLPDSTVQVGSGDALAGAAALAVAPAGTYQELVVSAYDEGGAR